MWLLTAGCKALLSVLLSTPSGLAYLVQQQEGSQSLISALQNRHAPIQLHHVTLLRFSSPCASFILHASVWQPFAQAQVCDMLHLGIHLVAIHICLRLSFETSECFVGKSFGL